MLRRTWFLLIVVLTAVALAACQEEGLDSSLETLEIEVTGSSLNPGSVTLRAPDKRTLVVRNEGEQPCSFDLGKYVRDLEVRPGGAERMQFVVPPDDPGGSLSMGCAGGPMGGLTILTSTAP